MRRTSPNGAKSAKRGIPPQGAEYKSEEIPHTQGRALKKAPLWFGMTWEERSCP